MDRDADAAGVAEWVAAGDADLARLSAPVGLDLGALTAEETAVSILGELIAVRRGHKGGRLKDANGRVHGAAS